MKFKEIKQSLLVQSVERKLDQIATIQIHSLKLNAPQPLERFSKVTSKSEIKKE